MWRIYLVSLLPTGTRLAFARSEDGPIESWSLRSPSSWWKDLEYLGAADSKALFIGKHVQDGTELLHVDLRGKATRLWYVIVFGNDFAEP